MFEIVGKGKLRSWRLHHKFCNIAAVSNSLLIFVCVCVR
jgi:hypothetical protein